jgi:hydroxypyruvate isomerase
MIVHEPLNVLVNHAGYFLVTTEEAVRMIKAVDSPNCKILFDIYHQQISEGNVIRNLTENIDLIGHFHIGDNPGRNQPGTGELNYTNIFKAIEKTGYDRWLAFECGRTVEVPELSKAMHELIDPFSK